MQQAKKGLLKDRREILDTSTLESVLAAFIEEIRESGSTTIAEEEPVTRLSERDPHAIRNEILQAVLEIQGTSRKGVDDTTIAGRLGLAVDEVRGHLGILDEEGRVGLSRTMHGHSAFLQPEQRQKAKESAAVSSKSAQAVDEVDPQKVFVVHGRNNDARRAMFEFLRTIGLHPLEWSEIVRATGKASPYIGEVLDAGFSMVQAVVVLMTPDDEARLREAYRGRDERAEEIELTPQPRPNVLIEAGMALGLFPERTVIVELGRLRPASDIGGRHVIRMSDSTQDRQDLADRLEASGCAVNLKGRDWHTAGGFEGAIGSGGDTRTGESGQSSSEPHLFESDHVLWAVSEFNGERRFSPHCPQCKSPLSRTIDYLKCPNCGFSELVSARKPSSVPKEFR